MFCSAGFGNRKGSSSAVPIVKASSQAIAHGYRAATRKLPLPVRSDICRQRDFLYSRGMKAHSSLVVVAALFSFGGLGSSTTGCSKEAATPAAPAMAPAPATPPPRAKPPLRVAFSDWPGWTAFEIGIQKGWFKEAGVDVKFD